MKYRPAQIALAILIAATGSTVADDAPRGTMDSRFVARAWQLHDWIVGRTDYQPLDRLPVFLFVSRGELNYLAFNETENGYSGQTLGIEGVYAPSIVFLNRDFALGEHDDVLLHELIHHFQEMSGAEFACVGASEIEAYRIQSEFVAETGIGGTPPPAFIELISQC